VVTGVAQAYDSRCRWLPKLTGLVRVSLTDADRSFLIGFEAGDPDWSLFPVAGAERLPAPRDEVW
jgi:hypothetical protein